MVFPACKVYLEFDSNRLVVCFTEDMIALSPERGCLSLCQHEFWNVLPIISSGNVTLRIQITVIIRMCWFQEAHMSTVSMLFHNRRLLNSSPSSLCIVHNFIGDQERTLFDSPRIHSGISVDPDLYAVPWDHLLLQPRHSLLAGRSLLNWAVWYPDLDTVTPSERHPAGPTFCQQL